MKNFYHNNRTECLAGFSALIAGFFTHLFALVTLQMNYDNVQYLMDGFGAGISSGRWMLNFLYELLHAFGFSYNLPAMNGFLFLAMIAVSAGLLVSTLGIQKPVSAIAIGMLMSVFPTSTSVLIFRFAAPAYALSVLLAVLAAWVFDRYKAGWLLSVLCMTCSLGIYQSNIPFTISIFVLSLLRDTLREKCPPPRTHGGYTEGISLLWDHIAFGDCLLYHCPAFFEFH